MKFARELKIGDIVNGHEDGWITVKSIEKGWNLKVTYQTMFGVKSKSYFPDDRIDVL